MSDEGLHSLATEWYLFPIDWGMNCVWWYELAEDVQIVVSDRCLVLEFYRWLCMWKNVMCITFMEVLEDNQTGNGDLLAHLLLCWVCHGVNLISTPKWKKSSMDGSSECTDTVIAYKDSLLDLDKEVYPDFHGLTPWFKKCMELFGDCIE